MLFTMFQSCFHLQNGKQTTDEIYLQNARSRMASNAGVHEDITGGARDEDPGGHRMGL